MIYAKGHIMMFAQTPVGERRAATLQAEFPFATRVVAKARHHVELLVDFTFQPAAEAEAARPTEAQRVPVPFSTL